MVGGQKWTVGRGDRRGSFGDSESVGGGDEAVVETEDWLLGEDMAESLEEADEREEERLGGWGSSWAVAWESGSDAESESESQSSTVGWKRFVSLREEASSSSSLDWDDGV